MNKKFSVNLRILTTNPDVIALIGNVADAIEKSYEKDILDMEVHTSTTAQKEYGYGSTLGTPTPPAEPDPGEVEVPQAPEPPKAETPRKRGRVKPEVREPAPEPSAPENMELPPPEPAIEGADAEVVEPVTSSTRELTRDDVFEALRGLVVGKGNAAAVRALQVVGVSKFSDCPTDRLADLFDAIQKEAA